MYSGLLQTTDELTTILEAVSDIKEVNICLVQAEGDISYVYPPNDASNDTIMLGQLKKGSNKIVSLKPKFGGLYNDLCSISNVGYN